MCLHTQPPLLSEAFSGHSPRKQHSFLEHSLGLQLTSSISGASYLHWSQSETLEEQELTSVNIGQVTPD